MNNQPPNIQVKRSWQGHVCRCGYLAGSRRASLLARLLPLRGVQTDLEATSAISFPSACLSTGVLAKP
jgi:hypothetical protein